jgi:hypothetical protein
MRLILSEDSLVRFNVRADHAPASRYTPPTCPSYGVREGVCWATLITEEKVGVELIGLRGRLRCNPYAWDWVVIPNLHHSGRRPRINGLVQINKVSFAVDFVRVENELGCWKVCGGKIEMVSTTLWRSFQFFVSLAEQGVFPGPNMIFGQAVIDEKRLNISSSSCRQLSKLEVVA